MLVKNKQSQQPTKGLCRILNIPYQDKGFFLERHPKLAPVNALTDGIFLAGCCQGPKDIPDTVAQAGAAAGEALALKDALNDHQAKGLYFSQGLNFSY